MTKYLRRFSSFEHSDFLRHSAFGIRHSSLFACKCFALFECFAAFVGSESYFFRLIPFFNVVS